MPKAPVDLRKIQSLVEVVRSLRGPDGCPWDKEQTHISLTQYAIEEVFELAEAIESADGALRDDKMREELGDVLFQVVLHAQLASERGAFNFDDVVETLTTKMVRRHPHVFSEVKVDGTAQVLQNWEEIKKQEKAAAASGPAFAMPATASADNLLNVPPGLPALQRAHKIGKRTEKLQFDWENAEQVWNKVEEEHQELREALEEKSLDEIEHELGDVLFSVAQLARHLKLEPEQVLRKANRRFEERFAKMKEFVVADGKDFEQLSLDEKEAFWDIAKRSLKKVAKD